MTYSILFGIIINNKKTTRRSSRMQNIIDRRMKRMSKPMPENATFADYLSRYTKEELIDIKRIWDFPISSSLRKQEIIDALAKEIPHAIPEWCGNAPFLTYEILTGTVDINKSDPMMHKSIYDLTARGIGYFSLDEDKPVFNIPQILKSCAPKADSIIEKAKLNDIKIIFTQGLVNLYGLIPMDELTEILNHYIMEKIDKHDLTLWIESKAFTYFDAYLGFIDGELFLIHENAQDPEGFLYERPDLEYADFDPDDLFSLWTSLTTKESWPYFEKLLVEIEKHEITDELKFRNDIRVMQFSFMNDEKSMNCIQPILDCVITENLEDARSLMQLMMDYHNHSPKWNMKGNAPSDLSHKRMPEAHKAAKASKKVGRNDPCPCGSGKKYKKCCLGKDEKNNVTRIN